MELPPWRIVPLDSPRTLTAYERTLLDFLLSGPLGRPKLREQARTAKVVGQCDCGCRSVVLEADPSAPSATCGPNEISIKPAVVHITAYGRSPDNLVVEVTLHVIDGRIDELEIWDGESHGAAPDPTTLRWDG